MTSGDPLPGILRRVQVRRRRAIGRRLVATTVVVAVLITLLVAIDRQHQGSQVVTGPASTTGPTRTTPAATTIALLHTEAVNAPAGQYASGITYLNSATGERRDVAIPSDDYGEYPVQMLRLGDRLVLPSVRSAPFDLSAPPAVLVNALVFVASVRPGRMWIISTWGFGNAPPFKVTEVDTEGHATSPEIAEPPEAWWPIGDTPEGLLLQGPSGKNQVLVWDPDTGRTIRTIDDVTAYAGNGWTAGDRFAWLSACSGSTGFHQEVCQQLNIIDLKDGHTTQLSPPPGTTAFALSAAPSPDGTRLAIHTPTDDDHDRLTLVDLTTGAASLAPSTDDLSGSVAAWSPDGTEVFYGQAHSTAIYSYQPTDDTVRLIDSGLPTFTALATG